MFHGKDANLVKGITLNVKITSDGMGGKTFSNNINKAIPK